MEAEDGKCLRKLALYKIWLCGREFQVYCILCFLTSFSLCSCLPILLRLGPLEKIPSVREAFEIPPYVTKIRRISTIEVVRHLQDYTSRCGQIAFPVFCFNEWHLTFDGCMAYIMFPPSCPRRMGLWSGVVDPRMFSQYLDSQLGVRDNEFLGVKVSSTILATQSFKKAHRDLESFKCKFRFELQVI